MQLDIQERLGFTSCYVCKYAGKQGVIWPQERSSIAMQTAPTLIPWEVVVTNIDRKQEGAPQGGRRGWEVCLEHDTEIYADWINIAQRERDQDNQFIRWIEEVECGRDLYG